AMGALPPEMPTTRTLAALAFASAPWAATGVTLPKQASAATTRPSPVLIPLRRLRMPSSSWLVPCLCEQDFVLIDALEPREHVALPSVLRNTAGHTAPSVVYASCIRTQLRAVKGRTAAVRRRKRRRPGPVGGGARRRPLIRGTLGSVW